MNGMIRLTSCRFSRGGIHPFFPFLILLSVLIPLPLFLLPVLLFVSLIVQSRAAPAQAPVFLVRRQDPPALRSPPF